MTEEELPEPEYELVITRWPGRWTLADSSGWHAERRSWLAAQRAMNKRVRMIRIYPHVLAADDDDDSDVGGDTDDDSADDPPAALPRE